MQQRRTTTKDVERGGGKNRVCRSRCRSMALRLNVGSLGRFPTLRSIGEVISRSLTRLASPLFSSLLRTPLSTLLVSPPLALSVSRSLPSFSPFSLARHRVPQRASRSTSSFRCSMLTARCSLLINLSSHSTSSKPHTREHRPQTQTHTHTHVRTRQSRMLSGLRALNSCHPAAAVVGRAAPSDAAPLAPARRGQVTRPVHSRPEASARASRHAQESVAHAVPTVAQARMPQPPMPRTQVPSHHSSPPSASETAAEES